MKTGRPKNPIRTVATPAELLPQIHATANLNGEGAVFLHRDDLTLRVFPANGARVFYFEHGVTPAGGSGRVAGVCPSTHILVGVYNRRVTLEMLEEDVMAAAEMEGA